MRQSNSSNNPGRLPQDHESPVHLIGLTQPHGLLIVLESSTFNIAYISENTIPHLGISAQALIGQNLFELIEPSSPIQHLQHSLETCSNYPSYHLISISTPIETKQFDGLLHRVGNSIILELEPTHKQTAVELTSLQNQTQRSLTHLRSLDDITDFLQAATTEVQAITGFERVMIYQFDENCAGSVVAEVKPPEKVSYLGLHYPATDIPNMVRQLYCQSNIRFIPDLRAPSVELVTAEQSVSQTPIDLSYAILRGVDPCCVEYHQNMGVTALLVIALVQDNQLWGLISCHHPTSKLLSYPVRSACAILGQLVAAEIAGKVDRKELNYLNNLQAIQANFIDSIAKATDFKQALVEPAPRLLDVVNAQGAAICLDQDITLIGETPCLEDIQALINWSLAETSPEIFHTNCLVKVYPSAVNIQAVASGLIVLTISKLRRYLILWFRPEVLQTINWAGNPHESVRDGQAIIGPRTSFEHWKETVRTTALPWKSAELANALALKNAIVGIVLNKADELAQINLELERSNRELDSFAYAASHDLKEPLRGITNFSNLLLRRYSESLDDAAVKRLQTLVKLAERMDRLIDSLLRFSRLGQTELQRQPTDLNPLLSKVIETLQAGQDENAPAIQIHVPRHLPTVKADSILISEVFSNLLSNALKYTDKMQPRVEVGYLEPDDPQIADGIEPNTCVIYVKDDGIGIHKRHFQNIFRLFKRLHERDSYGGGTGVGLTIAKKIIERHRGHIWVESTYGEGTTFYFVLNCEEK
ncbi:MAG: ATP-binding protein [Cyanobacteria bacterium P01_H01_bin.21]